MQRYFGYTKNNEICLNDDDIFHLTHVMRAKPNTEIEVVINDKVLLCKTTFFNPLKIEVIKEIDENNELPNKVVLIASLIKGEKMDLVLQKATELGVSEIILLETERTIVKIKDESKLERFNKILKEASEQSKRSKIPTLKRIIKMPQLANITADLKLIAYEEEKGSTISFNEKIKALKENQSIAIVIGPEGGFSKNEIDIANKAGFSNISLGKRILRAETASLYVLSVISNYLENK